MCVLVSQCGRESRGILEGQHFTSPLTGIEKVCDEMFTFIDKLSGENIDLLAASLHSSSSETVQEKAVNMIAAEPNQTEFAVGPGSQYRHITLDCIAMRL